MEKLQRTLESQIKAKLVFGAGFEAVCVRMWSRSVLDFRLLEKGVPHITAASVSFTKVFWMCSICFHSQGSSDFL